MFTLYTSNRMEHLADMAADVAAAPLVSPFEPEIIVVPNRGMERWLSMRFADRLGVWANAEFFFPNAFVQDLFRRVFAGDADTASFDPELLAWRIMALLPTEISSDERFLQLSSYLGDNRPLKRFQLSVKLADAFDQYMVFRPDMVLSWEQGKEDHWQAHLWRKVVAGLPGRHRARLWEAFFAPAQKLSKETLPERIIAFGHSSLPPYHIGIFAAIAMTVPVHLFVLNPCAEFWDVIVTEREAAGIQKKELSRKKAPAPSPPPALHLEQGNPLLAALGGYGRDFLAGLHDYTANEVPRFFDPPAGTLLGIVQSDIFHLRSRGTSPEAPRHAVETDDRSIQIHSCHGELREVEVLYDYLLDCFERKADLHPSDILVMTPDIQRYATFIKAVFGTPEHRSREIPYSIADLPLRGESVIAEAFLDLLSLPLSRFKTSDVVSLLEVPEIRSAFAIDESDLALITSWIRESGIRWGLDAPSLAARGFPASPENTWEAGMERLLLGYALPSGGERHFAAIAGYDHVEGSEALVAGKLAEFVKRCSSFADRARAERTPGEWSELLVGLVDDFFGGDTRASQDFASLRSLLHDLRSPEISKMYNGTIDMEIVIDHLTGKLMKPDAHAPFLSGGVSFCAMMPMRSIPFKVICCIGMNDTAFPRRSYHPSWDLLAAKPRRGDRSLEREDRYLFLEAMLSTREELYISFVGQSIRDNTILRPSVVVEELLEYMDGAFYFAPAQNAEIPAGGAPAMRTRIVTRHPLQPWSAGYFLQGGTYFSFSSANASAAERLLGATGISVRPGFCDPPLPPPPAVFSSIELNALIRFYKNPAKFFCIKRLGLLIDEHEDALDETEKFALQGLDRYRIAQELSARLLRGSPDGDGYDLFRAKGDLPHGNVGKYHFDVLAAEVGSFLNALRPIAAADALPPLVIDRRLAAYRLSGIIENLSLSCRFTYRFANGTPGDLLSLWIPHLFLNAFAPPKYPKTGVLIVKDARYRLEPLDDAPQLLEKLLFWFEKGLSQPLCFFPKSSYAYAARLLDKKRLSGPEEALDAALAEWNGNDYTNGERNDPYYTFCFRNGPPLGELFTLPAIELFGPLLDHLRKEEG